MERWVSKKTIILIWLVALALFFLRKFDLKIFQRIIPWKIFSRKSPGYYPIISIAVFCLEQFFSESKLEEGIKEKSLNLRLFLSEVNIDLKTSVAKIWSLGFQLIQKSNDLFILTLLGCAKNLKKGSGCNTAVEHMPYKLEGMG